MVQKQDSHYENLVTYAEELHEKNRKRVRVSGILMILLPVVLGMIRWLTDSDKTVFLIIWVICMFVLSIYLVSVEYLDHLLARKLNEFLGEDAEYDSLTDGAAFVPPHVRKAVRSMLDAGDEDATEADAAEAAEEAAETAAGTEEGGDE